MVPFPHGAGLSTPVFLKLINSENDAEAEISSRPTHLTNNINTLSTNGFLQKVMPVLGNLLSK